MDLWLTREFGRLARKNRIADDALRAAISRAVDGLIDARIGRLLIKQRIARPGKGRSSGYRSIIFFKMGERAVFLHLFEKSRTANLTVREEEAYRDFAAMLAELDQAAFDRLANTRGWRMIPNAEPEQDAPK